MHIKKLLQIGLSVALISSSICGNTALASEDETTMTQTMEAETQPVETAAPETSAPETSAPETSAPETSAPETQAPETQAPETQAPETQAPETQAPETQAPETAASETTATETQVTEAQTQEIISTEGQKETTAATQAETQTDSESQTVTEERTEDETEEPTEKETEALSDSEQSLAEGIANSPYATNEALIADQNIISVKPSAEEFRFTQVDAEKAVLKKGADVYEEKSATAKVVGKADEACTVYLLADTAKEWVFIESGDVRGFVQADNLIIGEVGELLISQGNADGTARATVDRTENAATAYTKTTTGTVIAEKQYAIARTAVSILDDMGSGASVVGRLQEGGLAYVLAEKDGMLFVESGDARGFVSESSMITGDYASVKVAQKGESSYPVADELIEPEDNKACYYTLTSVNAADSTSAKRKAIVEFALQFVGNPYVWGGTSLTNGADCSGFVQSVLANYGISIPRVACDQSVYGTQIPISDAEPGDLIFYAQQGYVYHVSMYIGDGQVVQAYSTAAGIITSEIGANAVWATKVIS